MKHKLNTKIYVGMNLLLFEKSVSTKEMIVNNLYSISDSFKTITTEDFNQLQNELTKDVFDVVIIDGDNIDGQFKSFVNFINNANYNTHIIVLLSFANEKVSGKFISHGANDCFDKITEFESFLSKVELIYNRKLNAMTKENSEINQNV